MQIKVYTIPIIGGENMNEEMNAFLRSKKILHVEKQFSTTSQNGFWSFCISYIEESTTADKAKVDYRQVLGEEGFKRFSKMREIRKQLAQDEGVPAYAVFTDEEMAALAKIEDLTAAKMKTVKGIGEKKLEKYGAHFLKPNPDEKSE